MLFKNRVEKLARENQRKSETLKKNIAQIIDSKIKSLIDMGIDIDDIDLKQVLSEVNMSSKMTGEQSNGENNN